MKITDVLLEFAPSSNPGGGNYLKALASAWYNDTFNTGDLHKGIKSQEDVERILERGIHCGDGKVRKYSIGYNSDFDGVEIQSDDHYEYSDYDDAGNDIDSRTGKPWGPYDVVAFGGNELDESVSEGSKYKCACHPGDADPDCPVHGLEPMEVGDALDVKEGDVVAFPKKHKGDLASVNDCPKCGGDLQGGKYQGHEVKVCMPCKQVYLPPNSGIDQQGNKIDEGSQIERKIARTQALIQDYYNRARTSKNDIKRDHYIDMARQLEYELDGMINDANQAEQDGWEIAQHDATPSATWNRGGLVEQGVAEGSLNELAPVSGPGGDNYEDDLHDILMVYIMRNEPGLINHFGKDEVDGVVANMVTMGTFANIDPNNKEDLADALDKIIDILNDDLPDPQGVAEAEQQKGADYRDPPEADYGDDYQDMVARVKKLAGLGPLKTVYDPAKRVYKNVPTAVQPKK